MIFNKIPYIFIIIFVIVSHVQSDIIETEISSSEIYKRAVNQCTSKGGQCMYPSTCRGTTSPDKCSNNLVCCLPRSSNTQNQSKSSNTQNKSAPASAPLASAPAPAPAPVIPPAPAPAPVPAPVPLPSAPSPVIPVVSSAPAPSTKKNKPKQVTQKNKTKQVTTKKNNSNSSSTQNKSNNSNSNVQCTSKGGQCMNPSTCRGTTSPDKCSNNLVCCLPKSPNTQNQSKSSNTQNQSKSSNTQNNKQTSTQNKSTNTDNEVLCSSKGGECVYPSTCRGSLVSGKCPNDSGHRCCIPKIHNTEDKPKSSNTQINKQTSTQNKSTNTDNEVLCSSKGGKCVYPSTCRGSLVSGKCPNDSGHRCCIPKIPDITNELKTSNIDIQDIFNNINDDDLCSNILGGQCKLPSTCRGAIVPGKCPNGSGHRCCIPKELNIQNKSKSSNTQSKLNDIFQVKCYNLGGFCTEESECRGIVVGECPYDGINSRFKNFKCCIDVHSYTYQSNLKTYDQNIKTETQNKSSSTNDEVLCSSKGGECMNPSTCRGTLTSGKCPHDSSHKCCMQNDKVLCSSIGGQCVYPSTCTGTLVSGKCPGDSGHRCCIDHVSTTVEAYEHFKNKKGNTAIADEKLIEEMKSDSSYSDMINEIKRKMISQITKEALQNGDTINAALFRTVHCHTLGSYILKIDYSFIPKTGDNKVKVHLWGAYRWDSLVSGGEPFNIKYDFYDEVTITVKSITNIFDATFHYGDNVGVGLNNTASVVTMSEASIEKFKKTNDYYNMVVAISKEISSKITDEAVENGEIISDRKPYEPVHFCLTLGRFHVNYEYAFIPEKGKNTVKIHFFGEDEWDFDPHEPGPGLYNKVKTFLDNIFEEYGPHVIAEVISLIRNGNFGNKYWAIFDFYDEVTINYYGGKKK